VIIRDGSLKLDFDHDPGLSRLLASPYLPEDRDVFLDIRNSGLRIEKIENINPDAERKALKKSQTGKTECLFQSDVQVAVRRG